MQGHAGTYRDIEGNEGECREYRRIQGNTGESKGFQGNTGKYMGIGTIKKNIGEYRIRKDVFIRENG